MNLREGDVVRIERHNDERKVIEVVLACYRYRERHKAFMFCEFCKKSGMLDFFGSRSWQLDAWRNKVTKVEDCPSLEDQYGNAIEFGDTVSNVSDLSKEYGTVSVALDENSKPYFVLVYIKNYATKYRDLHEGVNTVVLY